MSKFEESVNGIIIGDVTFGGGLYYDGRKQGGTINGADDNEILVKAKLKLDEIKTELGPVYKQLYPSDLWEVRIYE